MDGMKAQLLALTAWLAAASIPAAQFTLDASAIPAGPPDNLSSTENVDFGDVDLDGDWDVAMADGGDAGSDQNRLWVNQGGLQGGTLGAFLDETATRMPVVSDQSRDVEFADIDGDGDLDLHVANTSQIQNQSSRILVNQGLAQGGVLGSYADETAARYLGLGGAGSSIPASLVLPGGGFIDWTHDVELADLDNDGDMDLVQISIGGAAVGQTPTRMFLNDGLGFFTEFNPSGFMLPGSTLTPGSPALWAEGVYAPETSDVSGAEADIATSAEDGDLADIDGDFDLDFLLGDRTSKPRMFANRLEASGLAPALGAGQMIFRDVTHASFAPGWVSGNGAFEQEMGDMDGDGDVDILGVNWAVGGFSFNDKLLENDGQGHFLTETLLPGSSADDNEGDFLDFDSDGDLDIYIANFSGADRLYRNVTAGAGLDFVEVALPTVSEVSLDADVADVDGDGDPDVLVAVDNFKPNVYLRNDSGSSDVTAPSVPAVEGVGTAAAFAGVLPVRAAVYDNAPYYGTWYHATQLVVAVDGVLLEPIPMRSSGGQLFRGELPGNLVGSVVYRVDASDPQGNTGSSSIQNYVASGNTGLSYGTATPGGSTAIVALTELHSGSPALLAASTSGSGLAAFVTVSASKQDPPLAVPGLPNLILNTGAPFLVASGVTDSGGDYVLDVDVPIGSGGLTVYAQGHVLTGAGLFESSQGLELTVQP